jgi:hypothetical protein
MDREQNKHRKIKVAWIEELIDSGDYDDHIEEIFDIIISGNASQGRNLLEDIQKETTLRMKLSFYAAILSMLFGLALFALGLFLALNKNLLAGSVIASMGSAISGFITKTFLKIHQISLEQLNRFYNPILKEILLAIEKSIENLPDLKSKKQARISMIETLLRILTKSKLDFGS